MSILESLKANKGTVSSELGKSLAAEVLAGNKEILKEALALSSYELADKKCKSVRAGAAKIVECVAFEKPKLVASHLPELFAALEADEPQTRWMTLRTFGACAVLEPEVARIAIPYARSVIRAKRAGELCLASSADLYLGDLGACSQELANEVYPILLESTDNVLENEHDWLLEAFMKIVPNIDKKRRATIMGFAKEYENHPRKKTRERVAALEKLCV